MAGSDRNTDHALTEDVVARGTAYGFFETVRLLQRAHPEAAKVGHDGPAAREVIRFRPPLDLSFAATDVAEIYRDGEGRYEIACRFLSLYGAGSPLPTCFTEELLYEDRKELQRDFLDIFNHRLISLLFRAWEKYRRLAQGDADGEDRFSWRTRTLCRLERPDDPAWLFGFAGLLHRQPVSEASLERLLRAAFQAPVEVRSCARRWTAVPAARRTALGIAGCALGSGPTYLGAEVRDVTTAFAVVVGPVDLETFRSFLPGGERGTRLEELLARVQDELSHEVVLRIAAASIEPLRLATAEPGAGGGVPGGLGYTSWLGADAAAFAADQGADTVFVRDGAPRSSV